MKLPWRGNKKNFVLKDIRNEFQPFKNNDRLEDRNISLRRCGNQWQKRINSNSDITGRSGDRSGVMHEIGGGQGGGRTFESRCMGRWIRFGMRQYTGGLAVINPYIWGRQATGSFYEPLSRTLPGITTVYGYRLGWRRCRESRKAVAKAALQRAAETDSLCQK